MATAVATAGATIRSIDDIPWLGSESVGAFFTNIFMLQGLDASKLSWNYPAWSISVEFMAYLLFPFALPAIWRSSDKLKLVLALCLFALLTLLALITQGDFDQWDGPITLLRCLPEFILGALLYCGFRSATPASLLRRNSAAFGTVGIIIACLHVGAPDLLITCLFAALVLTAVLNRGLFSEIANVRPLIWLGDVSYSLYLIHGFVQFVATRLLSRYGIEDHANLSIHQSFTLMVLMVGFCLLGAHFTYFGVEIGCRQYLRSLLGSPQKMRAAPIMIPSSRP